MDDELRNFVEEKWGLYESALATEGCYFGSPSTYYGFFVRTLANFVLALGMSIVIGLQGFGNDYAKSFSLHITYSLNEWGVYRQQKSQ